MRSITGSTSIAEILKQCASARRIFDQHGLHGCGGENGPAESLEFFALVHQANLDALLRDINAEMHHAPQAPYVYQESLADYIYRRFAVGARLVRRTHGVPEVPSDLRTRTSFRAMGASSPTSLGSTN